MITPSYFETLDVPMVAGRGIGPQDVAGAPEVCVVNEFVRRFIGNRNPIGMRIDVQAMVQPARSVIREIVGVVGQIKERPDEPEPVPHVYVPWRRTRGGRSRSSSGPPRAMRPR